MPQWEYEVLDLNELPKRTSVLDVLNDAGTRGWELVSISPLNIAILKRHVAPAPAPAAKRRAHEK